MLLSMTGYGRAIQYYKDKTITIEVRSLNSKFTDLRFRLPQNYKEKEAELRKMVLSKAERGKIDISIDIKSKSGDETFSLNTVLFTKYYKELTALADELAMDKGDLMQAILKLPNVIISGEETLNEAEWKAIQETVSKATDNFMRFRATEGEAMKKDFVLRINNIVEGLSLLAPFELERITKLRQRLSKNLEEFLGKENVDENRFEQEVLFYLEKIDITEEKVRLEQHCKFFLQQLEEQVAQKGRKLSFIAQEMGREINTLGAKAYSSDIQRIVVKMKDNLEKIKEQVANIV